MDPFPQPKKGFPDPIKKHVTAFFWIGIFNLH